MQRSCFLTSSKLFLFCSVGIKQKALVFLHLANLDGGIVLVTFRTDGTLRRWSEFISPEFQLIGESL